jgi:hypothetical protein
MCDASREMSEESVGRFSPVEELPGEDVDVRREGRSGTGNDIVERLSRCIGLRK